MNDDVIFDQRIAPDTRLLYEIFKRLADDKGQLQLTTPAMGKYLNMSRWPISIRILPEMEQHGLISRDHSKKPPITQLLERHDDDTDD